MTNEYQLKDPEDLRRVNMPYGVMFSTQGAVQDVEAWLDMSCDGEWSLTIDGMDETLVKKSLKIMFELEADKSRFVNDYAKA